ncbi:histidine phosphotransferase ChpT [Pararhizobium mangrovi]|uniref:Histidine phosphotransferase n=1 Tax=Pararhizobium mangrovi TaxID=2590452 RepID=A0A506UHK8_9HYPH|nr:histidine phosphotransferase family protein [Pararhizobium mangrovi]TPW32789.1 histidine phosphotransferase [Pararhizobium mangrovi]
MPLNANLTLKGADLAALLCSRVCHDIISPVGAINNGLELLEEGGTDEEALELVRSSAHNASVRLKFARLAFGASGSAGASIDTGEAETVVRDFVGADRKTEVSWSGPRAIVPKNRVKLLLNLFLVAYGSIPRGGTIDIEIEDPETDPRFRLTASGRMCRVPPKFSEILSGELEEDVDAHAVQPYYTVLLAEESGMTILVEPGEGEIVLKAEMAEATSA